jgi:dihydroorotate dehydrogenase (NAD+) catalytic subunit
MTEPDLRVVIAGVELKNPVITASGTYGFGREYGEYYSLSELGAVCVKGLTLKERAGNPPPRIAETAAGILNSVGLQNPGIEAFLAKELPYLKKFDTKIIANFAGNTVEEYCEMARIAAGSPLDLIEMNVSCPNVREGGIQFGTNPDMIYEITAAVKKHCRQPLIVKLSPNVASIADTGRAVPTRSPSSIPCSA